MSAYLNTGLPKPVGDGLDDLFWEGLRENKLLIQHCDSCHQWQWGPEWICYHCHSFELSFEEVEPKGLIYSHERVWHPVHPALNEQGPYVVVLIELPQAGDVRMVGNLLGDPRQILEIGASVSAVFEHHNDQQPPFSLLQWQLAD
tara:strand:- start:866 stop:1300 length:435 start_codon:yes stop_codon:yes gene_type:complete